MHETPIYTEMITEAKRRTKRHSPERRRLTLMDEVTRPLKVTSGLAERQTIGIHGQKAKSFFPKRTTPTRTITQEGLSR